MEALKYRVAIIGNPVVPESRFDDAELNRLRDLNFNTIQLNIAWGSRPGDEALNLEDVIVSPGTADTPEIRRRRAELIRRSAAAKAAGFRTLFHFGAPRIMGLYAEFGKGLEKSQAVDACLSKPETTEFYRSLLSTFAAAMPDVDDLLLYTYDQEAWICSEFGTCPRCAGVPLHERLRPFLWAVANKWKKLRPDGRVWWEPWELSAGQIFAIVRDLPVGNFGLMLHSNIAEVQAANPVDTWFRNTARMASERGIPVIGEIFMSSATEEVEPLQHVACPRLVFQQIRAVQGVPGVVGIKEYFGTRPMLNDPNLQMAARVFAQPDAPLDEHLLALTKNFGAATKFINLAWEAAADGMERFPWDVCWKFRRIANAPHTVYHGWDGFWIKGHLVDSPSWCSTRRTVFMTTEDDALHPWLIEDIALRWREAAKCLASAAFYYACAPIKSSPELQADVNHWLQDVNALLQISLAYALHAEETLVAETARRLAEKNRPTESLHLRLRELLRQDADNQSEHKSMPPPGYVTATEMLARFNAGPAGWLATHLRLPSECRW
jgi:hypothetical protein